MAGVYIHIPYCRRKCYYCDFYSVGSLRAPWPEYARALAAEMRARAPEWLAMREAAGGGEPDTLYIGGGTPSQMPSALLAGLIDDARAELPGFAPSEITVELNPEDVTAELAGTLAACGVNRVSMGVQTLSEVELKAIGRRHSADDALRAYGVLRPRFADISLDLMFGLPLQSAESWRRSVEGVVALAPEHLSAYALMWEERTALCKMRSLGKVAECDEDLGEDMFRYLTARLAEAGYEHYEISNYCRPGHRSVHNSSYWTGVPYLGLGPGAHSYDGVATRRANPADVQAYIRHFEGPAPQAGPFHTTEHLSADELREEYVMTRLRRREGIPLADFRARFGERELSALLRQGRRHPALLDLSDTALSLRPEAVMRSDSAIVALL